MWQWSPFGVNSKFVDGQEVRESLITIVGVSDSSGKWWRRMLTKILLGSKWERVQEN